MRREEEREGKLLKFGVRKEGILHVIRTIRRRDRSRKVGRKA